MIKKGKLSVQYPSEVTDDGGAFSSEKLLAYYNSCKRAAENAVSEVGLKHTKHRILVLVDLQGVYLGVTRWLAQQNFPIDGGTVASRIAFFMIEGVVRDVEERLIKELGDAVLFEDLVRCMFRKEPTDHLFNANVKQVVEFGLTTELFYAPVPLKDIEWNLRKFARNGSSEARQQLIDVQNGMLQVHLDSRDYAQYDDFIASLKKNATVSRWEEGFFNFYVSAAKGLKSFDEKEVDTRLVIRAVDACVDNEADTICLISSDQDFIPLHERIKRSGTLSFQADASKFANPELVGRRIKGLGNSYVPVAFGAQWPMRIVCEATGHDVANGVPVGSHIGEGISAREFSALCLLHNALNDDFHLEAVTEGAEAGVNVFTPSIK